MQLCNICFYVNNVFVHITDKRTPSRPLGEVKLRRAKLVVRWMTTCEASVMKAIFLFSYYYIIILLYYYYFSIITIINNIYKFYILIQPIRLYFYKLGSIGRSQECDLKYMLMNFTVYFNFIFQV